MNCWAQVPTFTTLSSKRKLSALRILLQITCCYRTANQVEYINASGKIFLSNYGSRWLRLTAHHGTENGLLSLPTDVNAPCRNPLELEQLWWGLDDAQSVAEHGSCVTTLLSHGAGTAWGHLSSWGPWGLPVKVCGWLGCGASLYAAPQLVVSSCPHTPAPWCEEGPSTGSFMGHFSAGLAGRRCYIYRIQLENLPTAQSTWPCRCGGMLHPQRSGDTQRHGWALGSLICGEHPAQGGGWAQRAVWSLPTQSCCDSVSL